MKAALLEAQFRAMEIDAQTYDRLLKGTFEQVDVDEAKVTACTLIDYFYHYGRPIVLTFNYIRALHSSALTQRS